MLLCRVATTLLNNYVAKFREIPVLSEDYVILPPCEDYEIPSSVERDP